MQLASFGRSAAGPAFADRAWTWGVASAGLTAAYDPAGVPDEYFLLDPAGRIVYRDSVPVSTMGALLSHLRVTGSSTSRASSSGLPPPTTTGTLP